MLVSEKAISAWEETASEMKKKTGQEQLCDCCSDKVNPFGPVTGEFQFHNGTSNKISALCEDCSWAVNELLYQRKTDLGREFCVAAYTGSSLYKHRPGCDCKGVKK